MGLARSATAVALIGYSLAGCMATAVGQTLPTGHDTAVTTERERAARES